MPMRATATANYCTLSILRGRGYMEKKRETMNKQIPRRRRGDDETIRTNAVGVSQ